MSRVTTKELLNMMWGDDIVYVLEPITQNLYHRGDCKTIIFAKSNYRPMFRDKAESKHLSPCDECFKDLQTEASNLVLPL